MFFPSLERTAITFSTNKFYKLCFRTINKAAVDSSVSAESVAVKDDMVNQNKSMPFINRNIFTYNFVYFVFTIYFRRNILIIAH